MVTWQDKWKLVGGLVAAMWAVEAVNFFFGHALSRWGIEPRTLSGLVGIPLAPLLHTGPLHLLANTIPALVLGLLVAARGSGDFLRASLFITVVGGLGVWLIGSRAYHVGASGLVFGYFGYLVARGFVERSLSAILIAGATLFLYGGIVWGVLPLWRGVSWEGHLAGLLAGILAARAVRSDAEGEPA
ncbi:MAG: rhomboid family intramembrane serine protease [Alphaproteobacteria bacterium]|nr:rhomboid family intramembrane serine protease [Alphaproteobacteria bacterium]MBF0129408.1 rhomboid family intramembrane serine protease [Alphaproteobacteria bacterium]